jgi:hypothetical protein
MRVFAITTAMLLSSALGPVSTEEPGAAQGANQAQSVPVQPDRTPQESNQARDQERARGEDVQIGRDWKAHESDGNRVGRVDKTDEDHQTVGRDWRAHPEGQEKR